MAHITYLYPMPTTIVGADINKKPNFCTIAYIGIINHQPPMLAIGMSNKHFTYEGITQNQTFSVNIPTTSQLEITDYLGLISGKSIVKDKLFTIFYGELKSAPMIKECPLSLECKVTDILDYGGVDKIIIASIYETYSDSTILGNDNKPDINKPQPIIFSMHENKYYQLGKFIGNAWEIGKKRIK